MIPGISIKKVVKILLPGLFAVLSPREAVAKLGVGKLVQSSGSRDAEVTPYVLVARKIQL